MTELPPGWHWSTLGQIADVVGGVTKDSKREARSDLVEVPYLRVANVQRGRIDLSQVSTIRVPAPKAAQLELMPGDVLLNEGGDRDKLGRGWVWRGEIRGCIHQNHVFRARIKNDALDPKLLAWYTNEVAHKWFEVNGKQSVNLASISLSKIRTFPVPIPPADEQRRIVDIVEDHLSRLDAATSTLRVASMRAKSLMLAAMARAVGASQRDSDGEPAESLNFGSLVMTLPSGWKRSTIGQASTLVEYGTSAKTHASAGEGDVPVLRMGNLQGGKLDWASLKYLPSDHADVAKRFLRKDDLLFNRTNSAELVGKSAVFDRYENTTFASYLIRVRFTDDVDPRWANMVINSAWGRAYIASVVSQQVGQANVNGTKLKAFPLPVPPLAEQLRRIDEFSQWSTLATRLIEQVGRDVRRSEALRRVLLEAAFSGRLTGRSSDVGRPEEMAGV